MRRIMKSIIGVTLLEIMLVLAIASMVIVMSMKYYQSASLSQKVGAAASSITAIAAAGESLFSAKNSLITAVADIPTYLPASQMPSSPWGALMTISAATVNTYTITIPNIPATACAQLRDLVSQNTNMVMTCPAGTIVITG